MGLVPYLYRISSFHGENFEITQRACKTFARPLSEGEFQLKVTQRACKTFARPMSKTDFLMKNENPEQSGNNPEITRKKNPGKIRDDPEISF